MPDAVVKLIRLHGVKGSSLAIETIKDQVAAHIARGRHQVTDVEVTEHWERIAPSQEWRCSDDAAPNPEQKRVAWH